MLSQGGARVGGGDMPDDERQKASRLIEEFERELGNVVEQNKIPKRYVRPLAFGSVFCGSIENVLYVGYAAHFECPR
jgi:hypothetical protein